MLFIIVTALHVLAASILVLFILLHAGRGGGLSDMFGGGMSLGGSTVAEKNLDRLTVFAAALFTVTTISLGFLIKDRDNTSEPLPIPTPSITTSIEGTPTGSPEPTGNPTDEPTETAEPTGSATADAS